MRAARPQQVHMLCTLPDDLPRQAREIERTNHPLILGRDLNSNRVYRSSRPLSDLINDACSGAG